MKQKLVLAWVDNAGGFELTGRYRDRLRQYAETRAVPKAGAALWGDDTPELRERLEKHVAREAGNHDWAGFFLLDNNSEVLNKARALALIEARK